MDYPVEHLTEEIPCQYTDPGWRYRRLYHHLEGPTEQPPRFQHACRSTRSFAAKRVVKKVVYNSMGQAGQEPFVSAVNTRCSYMPIRK